MPKSRLRQLANFIRVFGRRDGIRLWSSLFFQYSILSRQLLRVRLPKSAAPMLLRSQDLPIFWQIMIMREYDLRSFAQMKRVMATYKEILSEGKKPIIVDCGGHVGLSAIWFATQFPEATVYVVEPDISNFRVSQCNIRLYANIIPLHGGVWSHPCRLMISNPKAGSASFRLQEAPDCSKLCEPDALCGYTIEKISEFGDARRLFVVKIDIEGAEAELFEGPTQWLHFAALVLIELHDWLLPWQGTSRNFFRKLAENDFDVVFRGENLFLFRP